MKRSRFSAFSAAVSKCWNEIAKSYEKAGGDPKKLFSDMNKAKMAKLLPPVSKALNELLMDPTKEDIATLSLQTSVVCKILLLTASGPGEREFKGLIVKGLEKNIQNYLKFKAASLPGKDNASLIELIEANTPV